MNFEIIKSVIDKWDPIELLVFAPKDEYDEESKQIFKCYSNDIQELGKIIFNVFRVAFEETFTRDLEECINVAKLIVTSN